MTGKEIFGGWLPIIVLILVVIAWTGPWSGLPKIGGAKLVVTASSSITPGATISAAFNWTPFVAGTAILVSWIISALLLRMTGRQFAEAWAKTWSQMWGACLVGIFIFGLAHRGYPPICFPPNL